MVDQNPSARNDPVYFLLVALLPCYTPFCSSGGGCQKKFGKKLGQVCKFRVEFDKNLAMTETPDFLISEKNFALIFIINF